MRSLNITVALVLLGVPASQGALAHAPCQAGPQAITTKRALLIGINTYSHPAMEIVVPDGTPKDGRYEPQLTYPDLKGPANDVKEMRDLLISEKFGFPCDEERMHVLLDSQATHDGILAAMEKYLVHDPNPGDTVVFYVSSHGSLRVDPHGHGLLYDLDGTGRNPTYLENTIVPYDWYQGKDDIFSRDLRHIFDDAADRKINLTAIFDSCHSGTLARGAVNTALVARDFDYDPRPMPPNPYPASDVRKDSPVLVLTAAQKDQSAIDDQSKNPAHGIFTSALIETLQALPASRPASDVFKRLSIAMQLTPNAINQQPSLDATAKRAQQPLFGGAAGSGPATTAIVSVDRTGIVIDTGIVADIGPGSEFTDITQGSGTPTRLKVTDSIDMARSKAVVIAPDGATVSPKDIVQLAKWVPAERPDLKFYAGTSNPPQSDIEAALAMLRAGNVVFAADPSTNPWTHHLYWDGAHWALVAHSLRSSIGVVKKDAPVVLGARLSAKDVKKFPAGSKVWFDAPLPAQSLKGLLPPPVDGEPAVAAKLVTDRSESTYVIAGTETDKGLQYAWFKRGDVDGEVQTLKGMGAGCSPNSPFPLRTDWVTPIDTAPAENALSDSAVQLARLNGWLHLDSSALTGQSDFAYQLALRPTSQKDAIGDGGNTPTGNYDLVLVGDPKRTSQSRWVYVLNIDCQGRGSVLWPYQVPAAMFPEGKERLPVIQLPGDPVPVGEPYGTDTYILLTTSTSLNDLSALDFSGVVTRGAKNKPSDDPLEGLLDSASAGTRAARRPTPTDWGIQKIQVQSYSSDVQLPPASNDH